MRSASRSYWLAVVSASVSLATLLRLFAHPVLGERGVFILAVLATAVSAHVAGLSAGIATAALTIPIAAVLFLGGPVPTAWAREGGSTWR